MFMFYFFDNLVAVSKLFNYEKYVPQMNKASSLCWFAGLALTMYQIVSEFREVLNKEESLKVDRSAE